MKKITIHGQTMTSIDDLHRVFQEEIGLQPSHFRDLDTLWEGLIWHAPMPITLEWNHFEISRQVIGPDADELMNFLYEVDEQLEELFTFTLKL